MVLARKGKLSDRGVHFLLPEVRHSPGPTQTRPRQTRPGQTRPSQAQLSAAQCSPLLGLPDIRLWSFCLFFFFFYFFVMKLSIPTNLSPTPTPSLPPSPRPASAFLINVARFYHKFYTPLAIFRSFLWPQLAQGINMSIYTSVYTLYMYMYLSV